MTDTFKTPEEWGKADVRTAFGNAMSINGTLMTAYADKVLQKAVADETEKQPPHLQLLKSACEELGRGLAESIRRHGMIPEKASTFIKVPGEGSGDPINNHVSIGAKAYALASGKPEDYVLYLTSMCQQLLSENRLWRKESQAKSRYIESLRDKVRESVGDELLDQVEGYEPWWD